MLAEKDVLRSRRRLGLQRCFRDGPIRSFSALSSFNSLFLPIGTKIRRIPRACSRLHGPSPSFSATSLAVPSSGEQTSGFWIHQTSSSESLVTCYEIPIFPKAFFLSSTKSGNYTQDQDDAGRRRVYPNTVVSRSAWHCPHRDGVSCAAQSQHRRLTAVWRPQLTEILHAGGFTHVLISRVHSCNCLAFTSAIS